MTKYSLFPRTYVSAPRPPRTRDNRQGSFTVHDINTPLGLSSESPPDRPLPPAPDPPSPTYACASEQRQVTRSDVEELPIASPPPDVESLEEDILSFFGDLLIDPAVKSGEEEPCQSPRTQSLHPMPSSPTLRRRHLPKIRTRPLTPENDRQQKASSGLPLLARRNAPALSILTKTVEPAPPATLRSRASFGSGPSLSGTPRAPGPAFPQSQATGMRVLKRSDHKRGPRPGETPPNVDLTFLPALPVDLSLYLESPLIDHAALYEETKRHVRENHPVRMPARKTCPTDPPRSRAEMTPAGVPESRSKMAQDSVAHELRHKAGYSRLRVGLAE